MNKNNIKQKVSRCVARLYREDKYLFACKVCERCLMFRLAYHLQKEFPDYFIDCEFNKMGFDERLDTDKVEPNPQGNQLKRMFADIIIHKRNSDTRDNFICLEVKKTKRAIDNDVRRLKMMTKYDGFSYENANYIYRYDFGFLVYLPADKNKSEVRIFRDGKN